MKKTPFDIVLVTLSLTDVDAICAGAARLGGIDAAMADAAMKSIWPVKLRLNCQKVLP